MNRRTLLALVAGALSGWALAAGAQQSSIPLIGFLGPGTSPLAEELAAFRQALGESGYIVGRNVAIEYRWAEGYYDRLPTLVADFVRLKAAVIVPAGNVAALAAKAGTSTIPIIFLSGADPVKNGLVASMSRPGGNATGVSVLTNQLTAKRVELLHQFAPNASSIGFLVNPKNPNTEADTRDARAAATALGLNLVVVSAETDGDLDRAFATLVQQRAGALLVRPDAFFLSRSEKLVALEAQHALPTLFPERATATVGGLMSYAGSAADAFRVIGAYSGRVLKGRRLAGPTVNKARAGDQSEDREGARAYRTAVPPCPSRRGDRMNRRAILLGAGCLIAWPLVAQAQQPSMPVLGYLSFLSADVTAASPLFKGVHQGLGEAGFGEGRNLAVEYRFADFKADRVPAQVADLVERRVAVIYANGPAATLATKAATSTIPVVFSYGGDAVKAGLVASLGRPGGNMTGVTLLTTELGPKRLELLRELIPGGSMIAMLVIPDDPDSQAELQQVQRAAQSLGQKIHIVRANSETEFEAAFQEITQQRCAALLVSTGGLFGNSARQLATLAERNRIPAIFDRRGSVDAGGLIGYGTNFAEVGRRAGILVGRVLNGEKPAELPVEQPAVFELVINLKTARALGLTVPPSLLARADEVIE